MKLARVLFLTSIATGLMAQTWDSSGNGMLKGTYYFRHVTYQIDDSGSGALYDAIARYGTITFSGTGTYAMSATLIEGRNGQFQQGTANGTYTIAASGEGFLSDPVFTDDQVYGLVNAQGIFVGSSTENQNFNNDVFIAAPLNTTLPTASTFKGSYSLAYMDLSSGNPQNTIGGLLQMSPDGAGNVGTVGFTGYIGASAKGTTSISNVRYIFSGGAGVVTFPASNTALFSGQYYLYFSPDGNFVFGGAPDGFDLIVGVRNGTGTPNLGGLYYEAGMDQNVSTLGDGYATLDTFYGSLSANAGTIVGHQRLLNLFLDSAYDYTYSDGYTVGANGTYSSASVNYVVGNGIRIGSGIGPFLGISVAAQAPAISSSLSTTGVFLNPTGIVNAGSSAPFTAAIAPGELLTLYGANLAAGTQVASTIPFPTTLNNAQVLINNIPAPIYYVTATQLSAIVPYGLTGAIATVQVINNNVPSNTVTRWINNTAPGVLTQQQNGLGYGDAVHQDGTLVNAKNPAQIGETLSVFLTGLGAVSPAIADGDAGPTNPLAKTTSTITAFIGGVEAKVDYAGLAPQLAGLYQINLTVPSGLTAGDNYLDISGPDSYTSVCLVAIGTSASASASPAVRRLSPALSQSKPRVLKGRKR